MNKYKVWLTISKKAIKHNFHVFRKIISPKTELWAVVKSNAYGHGLLLFSQLAESFGVDGFCVDSVIEGIKLRENGITKPILVLGPTLPYWYPLACQSDIIVTISNNEALKDLIRCSIKKRPKFHLKIDTGMHRQGFYVEDLNEILKKNRNSKFEIKNYLKGVYTHFASAKDINYPTFNERQFSKFQQAISILERAGFNPPAGGLKKHIAATAGTLINPKYHLDLVRIGIGLYGLWPSRELEIQLNDKLNLKTVLSWHALISEVKNIKRGDYIGYDFTERMEHDAKIAIVPIGYWHGLPRDLSSIGEVFIKNKSARILGRVSMDLITIDITNINCKVGDKVEIIPINIAQKLGASHYEIITRINPLIQKIIQ